MSARSPRRGKQPPMPAPHAPSRRGFLLLRTLWFLLSLPLLYWVVTRYGTHIWSYAEAYPTRQGVWFWVWTVPIVVMSWSLWRYLRRKAARARQLAAEIERR